MLAAINRRRDQHNDEIRRAWRLGLLVAALFGAGFGLAGRGEDSGKIGATRSGQRAGKASTAATPGQGAASLLPTSVLQKIPQRATGADGQPGDFVNILIVGTEADMRLAFQAARWTTVGHTATESLSSAEPSANLSTEEYVAMPLREESLFGKSQDYGFAQDALVTVVQARHDVRIWKVPFSINGQTLWAGAASHEGPWWDNNTGMVSYASDPNVDDERDFVGDSLRATGLLKRSGYVSFAGGSEKIPAAGSDAPQTDGRLFVMMLLHL